MCTALIAPSGCGCSVTSRESRRTPALWVGLLRVDTHFEACALLQPCTTNAEPTTPDAHNMHSSMADDVS